MAPNLQSHRALMRAPKNQVLRLTVNLRPLVLQTNLPALQTNLLALQINLPAPTHQKQPTIRERPEVHLDSW